MPAPKGTKAYRVSLTEFVVFAADEPQAIENAIAVVQDGALSLKRCTPAELRREFGCTSAPGPGRSCEQQRRVGDPRRLYTTPSRLDLASEYRYEVADAMLRAREKKS